MLELKRARTLKPCVLIFCLQIFSEFSIFVIWQPYIIQVLNAFGTPINASWMTVLSGVVGIVAALFLISTVKTLGRRIIYLTSNILITICTFALSQFQT